MIIGIGIDIDTISSTARAYEKEGDLYFEQFCTQGEVESIQNSADPYRTASIIFGVKEAFAKATGQGFSGWLWWDDVEVRILNNSDASVRFDENSMIALEEKIGHRPTKCHASFSVCDDVVIANCILET
jgi:phosphopantetheine--protein transferase-like protein